ncbi:MAG TPA: transporter substrate-binding domain-containing protein [Noviherbaspirillum sp.]|nr:transporter substrate-binding domain-containing protein [Noviherbaspirillum sp.]
MSKAVSRTLAVAAFSAASLVVLPAGAETVSIYTYHNHPPFIIDGEKELSHEFIGFLNRKSKGNPTFRIKIVPRARLDKIIATPEFNGAVVWVNPAWFRDKDRTTYLWSTRILDDANVILSNMSNKLEYTEPSSLKGKRFGGILGHNYADIDDLVRKGAIKREDVNSERSNLRKIEAGRIDATLLPRSTANYLLHEMGLKGKIYAAPTVHSVYTRHVLISKKNPALYKFMNEAISEMEKDRAWQTTLSRYKSN